MKKFAVALITLCLIACAGLSNADDKKTPVPGTIVSPELLGPHYLWSAEPPEEKSENDTNIQDRVQEEAITPATEDRIKEATDGRNN